MKAVVIEEYGGKENLQEKEVPTPGINDTQVLVELHATSINPIDWKVREGYLKDGLPFEFPIVLGWDAAGTVKEIGSNVQGYQVGDEVYARPATTRLGTYAEYVAVEETLLAKKPENLTFAEAASVPLAGLTAWQCLVDFGEIKQGDQVLIHAGSGGVGSFAIQIAKAFGAYIVTTASGKNKEWLEALGADRVINYREEDFSEILTDVDIVLDTLGGDIQEKSFSVLTEGGKLPSIVQPPREENKEKYGVTGKFIWLEPNGEQLTELKQLIENREVKPVVGHTFAFSLEGIQEAHALSETHHAKGKIVITM